MNKRRKNSFVSYIITISIVSVVYFTYSSSYFERKAPTIDVPDITYWNLKWDIPISISDSSGIKEYKVSLKIGDENEKVVLNKKDINDKEVDFILPIPKQNIPSGSILRYKIEATDRSNYNFFLGNTTIVELKIIIDKKRPEARIIAMSNKIMRGGSAVVVFYADDEALGNISISNGKESFVAFPFIKDKYYASIVPWPIYNDTFKGSIIVQDKAGNVKKSNIGFARYYRRYRTSNINLKNNFIDSKIAELVDSAGEKTINSFADRIDMFKYVNEILRKRDMQNINKKILNSTPSDTFNINVFRPLKDAVIVGLFGDHRKYTVEKQYAGESYHLGVDLASIKNAPVTLSNDGVAVISEELGMHGYTIVMDHGFGISSLYAHLSASYIDEGEALKTGHALGKTGTSGLALGDHLHFGISIQGIPVIPTEWMDSKWLKVNVLDVLSEAKSIIESEA